MKKSGQIYELRGLRGIADAGGELILNVSIGLVDSSSLFKVS